MLGDSLGRKVAKRLLPVAQVRRPWNLSISKDGYLIAKARESVGESPLLQYREAGGGVAQTRALRRSVLPKSEE